MLGQASGKIQIITKPSFWLVIIIIAFGLFACKSAPRKLNYESSVRSAFITTEEYKNELSNIIIVATPADAKSPGPGVVFLPEMETALQLVDFNQMFAVLILVGQIPENGQVKRIDRMEDKVQIILDSYSIGPGNYVVKGFTMNYQLILIEKSGQWNAEIEFVVKAENDIIIGEATHFIP
jgi:hypothetical protein